MRNRMTLSEARRRDKLIYDLAFYEVTQGMMLTEMSSEGIIALHKKIAKTFNHFKKLVKSGEYHLDELEEDVVSRNAAIASPTVGHSIDQLDDFVNEIDKEGKQRSERPVPSDDGSDAFMNMIRSLISGSSGAVPIPLDPLPEDYPYDEDEFDEDEDEFE